MTDSPTEQTLFEGTTAASPQTNSPTRVSSKEYEEEEEEEIVTGEIPKREPSISTSSSIEGTHPPPAKPFIPSGVLGTPSLHSAEVRNLFVNYLSPEVTDDQLRNLFSPYGSIESAKVMVDLTTGASKGFGFVKFHDSASAQKAIDDMNGQKVGAKTIVVKPAESSGSSNMNPFGTPSPNIYVKGLPPTITEENLLKLFSSYGAIEKHKLMIDPETKLPRGQAFIKYTDNRAAEYAIAALQGHVFPGAAKGIIVRFADTEEEKMQRKQKQMRQSQMVQQRYNPYGSSYSQAPPVNPYQSYYSQPMYPTQDVPAEVFVKNLPPSADDAYIYRLFGPYGPVLQVKVPQDKATNKCKGYGFVTMGTTAAAYTAIQMLNGYRTENKQLQVTWKK